MTRINPATPKNLQRRAVGVVLLCLTFLLSETAIAEIIRVEATGQVDWVNDPDLLLPFQEVILGESLISISFTYDANVDDHVDLDWWGSYRGTDNFVVAVDGISRAVASYWLSGVSIFDDWGPGITGRVLDMWAASATPDNFAGENVTFQLGRTAAAEFTGPLSSDALVRPIWPDGWAYGYIRFKIQDDSGNELAFIRAPVSSVITTVIPLPPALLLYGIALLTFVVTRRSPGRYIGGLQSNRARTS